MRSEEKNLHHHCLHLLSTVPAAAAAAVTFRRHWPSIAASSASLSTSLSDPSFPTASPLTQPLLASLFETLTLTLTLAAYCSAQARSGLVGCAWAWIWEKEHGTKQARGPCLGLDLGKRAWHGGRHGHGPGTARHEAWHRHGPSTAQHEVKPRASSLPTKNFGS